MMMELGSRHATATAFRHTAQCVLVCLCRSLALLLSCEAAAGAASSSTDRPAPDRRSSASTRPPGRQTHRQYFITARSRVQTRSKITPCPPTPPATAVALVVGSLQLL